jgi:hypothetical protein
MFLTLAVGTTDSAFVKHTEICTGVCDPNLCAIRNAHKTATKVQELAGKTNVGELLFLKLELSCSLSGGRIGEGAGFGFSTNFVEFTA